MGQYVYIKQLKLSKADMSNQKLEGIKSKKKVLSYYKPDSFRIFDEEIPDQETKPQRNTKAPGPGIKNASSNMESRNRPQAHHIVHITDNIRYLKQPINYMEPDNTNNSHWWPSLSSLTESNKSRKPSVNRNTTQRSSFSGHVSVDSSEIQASRGRHGSNPNINASKGILPSNHPKSSNYDPKKTRERISYIHHHDSSKNNPIKGRMHGSFVTDQIVLDKNGKEIINNPWVERNQVKKSNVNRIE